MKCRVNVFMFEEIIQSSTKRSLKNSVESLHVGICSLMVENDQVTTISMIFACFCELKETSCTVKPAPWLQSEVTTTPTNWDKKVCAIVFKYTWCSPLNVLRFWPSMLLLDVSFCLHCTPAPLRAPWSQPHTCHTSLDIFLALMRENYPRQKTIRAFKKGLVVNWKYFYHDLWFKRIDSY